MAITRKLTSKRIQRVCRTCLQEGDLRNLFDNLDEDDCLVEKLLTCTLIKFEQQEGLPKQICTTCIEKVNNSYSFAKLCETSNTILMNYLARNSYLKDGSQRDGDAFDLDAKLDIPQEETMQSGKEKMQSTQNGKIFSDPTSYNTTSKGMRSDIFQLSNQSMKTNSESQVDDFNLNTIVDRLSDDSEMEIAEYDSEFATDAEEDFTDDGNLANYFQKLEDKKQCATKHSDGEMKVLNDVDLRKSKVNVTNSLSTDIPAIQFNKNDAEKSDSLNVNRKHETESFQNGEMVEEALENQEGLFALDPGVEVLPFVSTELQDETVLVVQENNVECELKDETNDSQPNGPALQLKPDGDKAEPDAKTRRIFEQASRDCMNFILGSQSDSTDGFPRMARELQEFFRFSDSDDCLLSNDSAEDAKNNRKRQRKFMEMGGFSCSEDSDSDDDEDDDDEDDDDDDDDSSSSSSTSDWNEVNQEHDGGNEEVAPKLEDDDNDDDDDDDIQPFTCQICNKKFSFEFNLRRHVNTHVKPVMYSCKFCEVVFTQWSALVTHVTGHYGHEPPFVCWCKRSYTIVGKLSMHLKSHYRHDSDGIQEFSPQPQPRKRTRTRAASERHTPKSEGSDGNKVKKAKDESGNLCDICGKTFLARRSLEDHYTIHTGERKYECTECGKRFRQKLSLATHKLIHSNIKRFICEQCGKAFRQSAHLRHHIKVHRNDRDYICYRCAKGFTSNGNLQAHLRVHDAKDKYECCHCKARFFDKKRFKLHLALHGISTEDKTQL